MTYILGSRCSNGVVFVADRKFTIEQSGGIVSVYDSKLYGEYKGIITGFAGNRGKYENFIIALTEYLKTEQLENRVVRLETFLIKCTEIIQGLHSSEIDVLFGITNNASILKHMMTDGGIETIKEYVVIGSEPIGRYFLKKYWKKDMNMEEVAELGFFIIKVIELYGLDESVGVDKNKPQIWFVPDGEKDVEASPQYLGRLGEHVTQRLEELIKQDFFDEMFPSTILSS